MALHTDLPIHRTGVLLLALAIKVQEQMPRGVKRSLGDKISDHCVEMLDLMAPADTGLPIGNLSSQFFANVLLNDLDQHAKHRLRAPHYVRYVDDFVLLHESSAWLNESLRDIAAFLPRELQVRLNPRKTILQPVDRGIDFVGHVIKPWRCTTRPGTVARAIARMQDLPAADVHQVANSYFGLMTQATHSHTDRARFANAVRYRGHCITGNLTKAYP